VLEEPPLFTRVYVVFLLVSDISVHGQDLGSNVASWNCEACVFTRSAAESSSGISGLREACSATALTQSSFLVNA